MRFQPQRAGGYGRIDSGLFPPRGFITTTMDLPVVAATQRHGEFIARLARKRAGLGEAQMMGIAGDPTANQTRLFGNEPDMVLVANPARLGMGQQAFVDALGNRRSDTIFFPPRG